LIGSAACAKPQMPSQTMAANVSDRILIVESPRLR
jgi:hypothetical protein